MSTIVTRAGKGSPLTWNEADNNFTNLNTDKYQSGSNVSLGTIAGTTITSSALTSGRVTFASTGGLLADSANLTFNGNNLNLTGTNASGGTGLKITNLGDGASLTPYAYVNFSTGSDDGESSIRSYRTASGTDYQTRLSFLVNPSGATHTPIDAFYVESNGAGGTRGYFSGSLTVAGEASIHGITVGLGGGSVGTNTAVGGTALASNVSGVSITAVGQNALYANTGSYNTGIGQGAMYFNTTGTHNVALGTPALLNNTTGSYNTGIGDQALYNNTTASYNTAVGYQAGYSNTTGVGNVTLGYTAGNTTTTGNYNIYIGPNSVGSGVGVSQEIVLGTQGGASIAGKGANTGYFYANGGGVYQGNNSTLWSITSDQRLKKNIIDNAIGLDKICAIQVRNFEYRLPNEVTELDQAQAINIKGVQLGAIAQELQQVLPDCVKTESTGVMSVDASNITWYLINAVKELSAKVTALEAQLGAK